jgi:large repetitive protein
LGGTLPHSYSWSGPNGFSSTSEDLSGLSSGSYAVTISDANGCKLTESHEVISPTTLSVTGVSTAERCSEGKDGEITVIATGGQTPYSYAWSHGDNTSTVTGLSAGTYTVTVSDEYGCTATGNYEITAPGEMTLTSTVTANCDSNNDGTISLMVSGGNSSYSYNWTGGGSGDDQRTGLGAGEYFVTVTDGYGCMVSDSFELTPLVVEFIKVDRTCSFVNGRSLVSATGGVEPYSYQWSNGGIGEYIENLDAGMYSVTVSAGGCIKTGSVTITVPSNCVPPVGLDDHYTTVVNLPLTGTAMPTDPMNVGYDSDPFYPLDSLLFENIDPLPDTIGLITWDNDGGFVYTPALDYIGSFSLQYEVCNPLKLCDSAFLIINVLPACPVITNDVLDNLHPTTCTGTNGSIKLCGLIANQDGYVVSYQKDGVVQTPLTVTADSIGCVLLSGWGAGSYSQIIITHPVLCVSGSNILGPIVLTDPTPPTESIVGTITQPTCTTPTGSVVLSGLPATGTWTLTRSPGGTTYTGNGTSYTVTGLSVGNTYTFTVTNVNTCISPASANVVISLVPGAPMLGGATVVCVGSTTNVTPISGGTWSSSNTGMATITEAGVVTGVSAGNVTLTYTSSSTGCSATWTVNVTNCPKLNPDFGLTYVNVPLIGDVSTNDQETPNSTYSNPPANLGNPSNCLPFISSNGSYTFVCGTIGVYNFYVPVCQPAPNQSICSPVLLQIKVLPLSDPTLGPIANPDYVRTLQNVTVPIPIRSNDKCQNGPNCTLSIPTILTMPLHGSYNVGTGIYTPVLNYVGIDSFYYRVCDNQVPSKCAQAWVYIIIDPLGTPNLTHAMDDYAQTPQNTPVSANVKTNDSDPEGNTQTVTAQNTTIPGKGTLVLSTSGVFTFTPVNGYYGPVDYPYTTCDNGSPQACATATVHILVESFDPTFSPDFGVTYVNVPLTGDVSTNDNETPNSTYINPSANPNNPSPCMPVVSSNGSYTFVCGVLGIYNFYVPVCEPAPNTGSCTPVLLQIRVLGENIPNAEPIANPDYVRTLQDVNVNITVRNNDKCQNGPLCSLSTPTLVIPPTRGVYNPSTEVYNPDVNFVGIDSLKYQVCDDQIPSKCTQAWAYITIDPAGTPNLTNAMDDYAQTSFNTLVSGNAKINDTDPEGNVQTVMVQNTTIPGKGTLVLDNTGTFTFTPVNGYYGLVAYSYTLCDNGTPQACATATIHILVQPRLCIKPNLKVLLEGSYVDNGSNGATMTTKLNSLGYLPGQKPSTFFGIPTPVGQPYSAAPWNYSGTEGASYTFTPGVPATYKANYPTTTTDWVLVSLRETTSVSTTVCTKAALLHSNGTVEMISGFDCCELDQVKTYYIVVEHRNHLMAMSHIKVGIANNSITYDFTAQQSYKALLGFGQKLINGKYVMYSGNGQQVISTNADTDINVNDKDTWLFQNGRNSSYYTNDLELNGDVNVQDKNFWLINNGKFSDVPR